MGCSPVGFRRQIVQSDGPLQSHCVDEVLLHTSHDWPLAAALRAFDAVLRRLAPALNALAETPDSDALDREVRGAQRSWGVRSALEISAEWSGMW